jgi:menaquinone-dependent protoporphyrinogen IX oxidase
VTKLIAAFLNFVNTPHNSLNTAPDANFTPKVTTDEASQKKTANQNKDAGWQ